MFPGPDSIIACPSCGFLARYGTLLSGNTIGAEFWTDGKVVAPMLPDTPIVGKCRTCASFYLIEKARRVGEEDPFSDSNSSPGEWDQVEEVLEPIGEEWLKAIDSGLAMTEAEEKELRIRALWSGNEPIRKAVRFRKARLKLRPTWFDSNLEALLPLLSMKSAEERILKAEVYREMGMWSECLACLGKEGNLGEGAPQRIRTLCRARVSTVGLVPNRPKGHGSREKHTLILQGQDGQEEEIDLDSL